MALVNIHHDRTIRKITNDVPTGGWRTNAGSHLIDETSSWNGQVRYQNASNIGWDNTMTSLEFKTDSIAQPASLTLYITITSATANTYFYVCRSFREADNATIETEDYRSWLKAEQGGDVDEDNIVKYSDKLPASSGDTGTIAIPLNLNARQDLAARNYLQLALVTEPEVDDIEDYNGGASGGTIYEIDTNVGEGEDAPEDITLRPYLDYDPSTPAKLKITSTKVNLSNSKIKIS